MLFADGRFAAPRFFSGFTLSSPGKFQRSGLAGAWPSMRAAHYFSRSRFGPSSVAGLICRLMTSAARSKHLAILQSRLRDAQQTSRGKFDRLPHATAKFTTSVFDGYGLRDHWLARPAPYASDPVLVHRLVRLLRASFRPHLTMTPLRFAMTSPSSGCQKDFHVRAVEHARHTRERRHVE